MLPNLVKYRINVLKETTRGNLDLFLKLKRVVLVTILSSFQCLYIHTVDAIHIYRNYIFFL